MKTSIILIDFENVQPKDLAPLRGGAFKVKLFCGANQTRIPTTLVAALLPMGPDAELITIQGSGRNALDFHIAYYIGRLSAEFPGAAFYIVSRDTGFDPLIHHLQGQGIECRRVPSLAEIPGVPSGSATPHPDRIQRVADHLLALRDSRPRKIKTLTAYIKGLLNAHASELAVQDVIAQLTERGLLVQPDGKLTWPSA